MSTTPQTPDGAREFAALGGGGLDWDLLPLRLYAKGNARFWDPAEIDFSQDAEDWKRLDEQTRHGATLLAAVFLAGEEAVTRDIQPFMAAMAAEGRFADEMYLAQFCYEESRHVQVFRRWLDAVGVQEDLNALVAGQRGQRVIFGEALPQVLGRLHHDPSPANQVRASITYNHIVEGVLALTGYHIWGRLSRRLDAFPGMRQVITRIGQDERRHMAWGTYTCRRHVAADPALWEVAEKQMRELMPHALHQLGDAAEHCPPESFGFTARDILTYAMGRARRRLNAISSARGLDPRAVEADAVAEELEDAFAAEEQAATPQDATSQDAPAREDAA